MEERRAELEAWDDKYLWHPFTPHSVYRKEEPLLVAEGDGNYLIDVDGNRYLDGISSLWCNLFGHKYPKITRAISDQLNRISHSTFLGNASVPAINLAKRLVDIAPDGLTRVFFSDNGSTAVEVALKIAYQFWQQTEGGRYKSKRKFLTLKGAYHGDTIGSVSLGAIELFHSVYHPLLFETINAPSPYTYRRPEGMEAQEFEEGCIKEIERLIAEYADNLAAVVMEPVMQGAAGMIRIPTGFLTRIRKATERAGCLLVLDEVAMGFGRTGKLFACEHEKISPDLLCLAKGLTGGYIPMAATLATEQIFEAFLGRPEEFKTFYHGHTYTGNQLASAAALATLDIFEQENVIEKLQPKIEYFTQSIKGLYELLAVGDIRHFGLVAGIELVRNQHRRESYTVSERRGVQVCLAARHRGVFLRPLGDTIILVPPLSITLDEIDLLIDAVYESIKEITVDAC
jgi:adenosylmethionine---8-amino-7-oxononanoate aminotransferase